MFRNWASLQYSLLPAQHRPSHILHSLAWNPEHTQPSATHNILHNGQISRITLENLHRHDSWKWVKTNANENEGTQLNYHENQIATAEHKLVVEDLAQLHDDHYDEIDSMWLRLVGPLMGVVTTTTQYTCRQSSPLPIGARFSSLFCWSLPLGNKFQVTWLSIIYSFFSVMELLGWRPTD